MRSMLFQFDGVNAVKGIKCPKGDNSSMMCRFTRLSGMLEGTLDIISPYNGRRFAFSQNGTPRIFKLKKSVRCIYCGTEYSMVSITKNGDDFEIRGVDQNSIKKWPLCQLVICQ